MQYTILKRSTLSSIFKKSTLLQEALRHINNIGPGLPWDEMTDHLSKYINMLFLSGYSKTERFNYIKGASKRMGMIDNKIKAGIRCSRFRTVEQI